MSALCLGLPPGLACMCLGAAGPLGGIGAGGGGGADAHGSQLLPLLPVLSLPRSFSSMSDITGKGPRTLHGESSRGGGRRGWGESFSVYLRPMLPALSLACDSLPQAQLCPGQAGRLCSGGVWGSGFTLSSALVLAVLCGGGPPSVLVHPSASSGKLQGHPGRPRPSPEPSGSRVFVGPPTCLEPKASGLWVVSGPFPVFQSSTLNLTPSPQGV